MKLLFCILLSAMAGLLPASAQLPRLSSLSTASATVYLDFDGQYVLGTAWNMNGDINAAAANYNADTIREIFNRVAEDYRPFNLNITTDSTLYWAAPRNKRMRIIVTPSSQWYGSAGGVAYTGSFIWGDNTPAWVFCALLGNRPKWVAEAVSHEIGHTLGLQHQSVYDASCKKIAEYNTGLGSGEIGWAPIMGAGYYQNHTTWHTGANTIGCNTIQNDFDIISTRNGFGLRPDDVGNTILSATPIQLVADTFAVSGLISTADDIDVFQLQLSHATTLKLNAIPQNVGMGDDGANVDIQVTLMNGTDTINRYNPLTLLNAGVDTNLNAGNYYLLVDGVGNAYHNDIGSIGLYNLTGSIATALPMEGIQLTGTAAKDGHHLSWSLPGASGIQQCILEWSQNGQSFSRLFAPALSVQSFSWEPSSGGTLYYRLRVMAANGKAYLSPTIALRSHAALVQVLSASGTGITVSSSGPYDYQLLTVNGQLLGQGKLQAGINHLPAPAANGLILLHAANAGSAFTLKLIKQ